MNFALFPIYSLTNNADVEATRLPSRLDVFVCQGVVHVDDMRSHPRGALAPEAVFDFLC